MKKRANILISAIVLMTLLFSSFSVFAAEGDDVIYIDDIKTTDYVGISIDGYFTDWADKPHSPIYYDISTSHSGSLFRDEDYVYLHIQMNYPNYTQFNGYGYRFVEDGHATTFNVLPASGGSIGNGFTDMIIVRQNGNKTITGASGMVYRTSGQGDQMELRIPLTFFDPHPDRIVTLTVNNQNLGPQVLTATGTPTLPFIIAGSGLVVASFGYFLLKRKRNR